MAREGGENLRLVLVEKLAVLTRLENLHGHFLSRVLIFCEKDSAEGADQSGISAILGRRLFTSNNKLRGGIDQNKMFFVEKRRNQRAGRGEVVGKEPVPSRSQFVSEVHRDSKGHERKHKG